MHLVKNIQKVEPFRITLSFKNGEVKTVDLFEKLSSWSKSKNSKFTELLQPEYFTTVKFNPELETIYWDNGIDFCPDTIYQWAE